MVFSGHTGVRLILRCVFNVDSEPVRAVRCGWSATKNVKHFECRISSLKRVPPRKKLQNREFVPFPFTSNLAQHEVRIYEKHAAALLYANGASLRCYETHILFWTLVLPFWRSVSASLLPSFMRLSCYSPPFSRCFFLWENISCGDFYVLSLVQPQTSPPPTPQFPGRSHLHSL